jgi:hypothetical protein
VSTATPRWLRTACLIVVVLALAAFGGGLVVRVQELQQVCLAPAADCQIHQLPTPPGTAALAAAGLSLRAYAGLQLAKYLFFVSLWFSLGALIFARKAGDWVALVTAYLLMTFPTQWDGVVTGLASAVPNLAAAIVGLQALVGLGLPVFLAVFPTGRLQPRWTRWLVLGLIVSSILDLLAPAWQPYGLDLRALSFGLATITLIGLVVAQFIRYRRYSDATERDRTRWVILGLALATAGLTLVIGLSVVTGSFSSDNPLAVFTSQIGYQLSAALIPLSLGLAIFRSRLFDLNVIIRRTLIYAVLSALLAVLYFGSVVIFESVLRGLIGAGSQLAIVLSTLLIAALFGPLRGRVQRAIDRRFYRRKYDAARTLAAFGASVRDEVDLDALGNRLTAVVEETMQPTQLSLWVPNQPPAKPL